MRRVAERERRASSRRSQSIGHAAIQQGYRVRYAEAHVEHQLRALGDAEATRSAGKVDWELLYDQLPARFSAREVTALAGVGPGHVASVMHRWRGEGRIVGTARGKYRKVTRGEAEVKSPPGEREKFEEVIRRLVTRQTLKKPR